MNQIPSKPISLILLTLQENETNSGGFVELNVSEHPTYDPGAATFLGKLSPIWIWYC